VIASRSVSAAREPANDSTLPGELAPVRSEPTASCCVYWAFPPQVAAPLQISSGQRYLIGRAPESDVVVDGRRVSRAHLEIAFRTEGLIARDLGSRNGTFVNGQSIDATLLKHGDVLRVGDQIGVVLYGADVDAPLFREIANRCWAGPTLTRALASAKTVARSDLPLIMQGPTGTGKERAARAVHEWSQRTGPFVAINCAAIPEQLAEAEFFGYRRGAFTGAETAGVGHLRAAHYGTLLLDEVSDLPLHLQAKLLRVMEQNEVQPLGETRPVPIDVRIIAATQVSLESEVSKGRFRADLHARLNGLTICLPPLSARREEIPALFLQLMRLRLASAPPRLDASLMERLMLHEWPGNVRELELLTRRLLGLHGHEPTLGLAHLDGSALAPSGLPSVLHAGEGENRNDRDLRLLLSGLRDSGGNLTQAANLAGISRQRAYRLLQEHAQVDLETLRKRDLQ